MIIYHGSQNVIRKPTFGVGNTHNDYGPGFYCTEIPGLAKEWAVSSIHDGYANKYELPIEELTCLAINRDYSMLHWLTTLLENRTFNVDSELADEGRRYLIENFHIDITGYDVLTGFRADDSYFAFASDFLNGTISYRKLCEAMQLGKLGTQIVLKSPKAFDSISFIGYERARKEDWNEKRRMRDQEARMRYLSSKRGKRVKGELYITTILDEEVKSDDPRL